MQPEEIQALRRELSLSPRKLAEHLGTDSATVLAWERGELYPTRKACRQMQALRSEGASGEPAPKEPSGDPLAVLGDPQLWSVVQKLCRHAELRRKVFDLAARYDDAKD